MKANAVAVAYHATRPKFPSGNGKIWRSTGPWVLNPSAKSYRDSKVLSYWEAFSDWETLMATACLLVLGSLLLLGTLITTGNFNNYGLFLEL